MQVWCVQISFCHVKSFYKNDNTLNQVLLPKASHISICYQGKRKGRNALIQLQESWQLLAFGWSQKKYVRVRHHPPLPPSFLEREVSPESVSPSKILNVEGYIPWNNSIILQSDIISNMLEEEPVTFWVVVVLMMMMIDKHNSCKIHQQPRQLLSHSLFGGELTLKWWWWWRSWRWRWWLCWSWWSSRLSHSLVFILATWKAQQWHQDSVKESEVWILSFWLVWSHIACSDYDTGCCVNHHDVDCEAWP